MWFIFLSSIWCKIHRSFWVYLTDSFWRIMFHIPMWNIINYSIYCILYYGHTINNFTTWLYLPGQFIIVSSCRFDTDFIILCGVNFMIHNWTILYNWSLATGMQLYIVVAWSLWGINCYLNYALCTGLFDTLAIKSSIYLMLQINWPISCKNFTASY